jgi:hypothetical protein
MTASSGPSSASKRPAFASKQLGYRMVSCVPWKVLMRASSCLCRSWVCGGGVEGTEGWKKAGRYEVRRGGRLVNTAAG